MYKLQCPIMTDILHFVLSDRVSDVAYMICCLIISLPNRLQRIYKQISGHKVKCKHKSDRASLCANFKYYDQDNPVRYRNDGKQKRISWFDL